MAWEEEADRILKHVGELLASTNENEMFYIRRRICRQLRSDEWLEPKNEIRNQLFEEDRHCYFGKERITEIKGIELHRIDDTRGYFKKNCVLTCKKHHKR